MIALDLLEPYKYEFFRNGLLVAVIAGALCGLLGVFVVLRGMSYIGHGLSHAVFGGAAASAVMKVNYFPQTSNWCRCSHRSCYHRFIRCWAHAAEQVRPSQTLH